MSERLGSPEEILAAAREILPWMIEIRRDVHQHPELGLEEHRTSERVQQLLGYSIHPPFMGHVDGRHPAKHLDPGFRDPAAGTSSGEARLRA